MTAPARGGGTNGAIVSTPSMPLAAESTVCRAATPLLTWAWEQFGEHFGDVGIAL